MQLLAGAYPGMHRLPDESEAYLAALGAETDPAKKAAMMQARAALRAQALAPQGPLAPPMGDQVAPPMSMAQGGALARQNALSSATNMNPWKQEPAVAPGYTPGFQADTMGLILHEKEASEALNARGGGVTMVGPYGDRHLRTVGGVPLTPEQRQEKGLYVHPNVLYAYQMENARRKAARQQTAAPGTIAEAEAAIAAAQAAAAPEVARLPITDINSMAALREAQGRAAELTGRGALATGEGNRELGRGTGAGAQATGEGQRTFLLAQAGALPYQNAAAAQAAKNQLLAALAPTNPVAAAKLQSNLTGIPGRLPSPYYPFSGGERVPPWIPWIGAREVPPDSAAPPPSAGPMVPPDSAAPPPSAGPMVPPLPWQAATNIPTSQQPSHNPKFTKATPEELIMAAHIALPGWQPGTPLPPEVKARAEFLLAVMGKEP